MRVLVVYCHPVETSFAAALHQEVLRNLKAAGHEVDDWDLYAEGFDPVMSREERLGYHEVPANREKVQGHIDRLQRAEAIVFCFPTWCFGLPAMLKGWFDRVLVKGYAYGPVPSWSGPLGDKRALLVMTSSYSDGAFRAEGSIGDIATVLRPVTYGTLAYCGMQVLEPFIAYGADEVGDDTRAGYLAALRARLGEL